MCVEQFFFFWASNGHEYLYSSPLMKKSHVESRKITNQICCSGYIFFKEPQCVLERLVSYRECRNAGLFHPRVSCVMLLLVLRKSQYVTGVITSRMFISHESMLYCFFSCIENYNTVQERQQEKMSNCSVLQLLVKHGAKICIAFAGYFISMNIPPQKQDETYAYV